MCLHHKTAVVTSTDETALLSCVIDHSDSAPTNRGTGPTQRRPMAKRSAHCVVKRWTHVRTMASLSGFVGRTIGRALEGRYDGVRVPVVPRAPYSSYLGQSSREVLV